MGTEVERVVTTEAETQTLPPLTLCDSSTEATPLPESPESPSPITPAKTNAEATIQAVPTPAVERKRKRIITTEAGEA